MYLKSLQMVGFKSFVDETMLEFEPGITAIVGPNGCGKSNISDAIKWVLGEQSAKLLRGSKMEDFIFNGSESRKALSMAEVSISMGNLKGMITSSEFSGYEEITVSRRLFRSGESEYYINKTQCRLKDVVDVFLDTGISTRGFSIIEHEQVGRIINSKPEDRRFIFEEAAGVMKYKYRRNAAIQKLESSQQNLLRISDIVNEIERQMNSLKRQANKAERYKKYRGEIRELGLKLLSIELHKVYDILKGADDEYNIHKEKEVEVSAKGSSLKNTIENLRIELTSEEKALANQRQEEYELETKIERDEEHIELMKRQFADLSDEEGRASEEIDGLKREMESLDSQYNDRILEMKKYSSEIEEQNRVYNEKEGALLEMNKGYKELQSTLEGLDTEILKLLGEISQKKNNLSTLDTRLDFIKKRKERVIIEKKEIEDNLNDLNENFENTSKKVTEITGQLDKFKMDKDELALRLNDMKERLNLSEKGLSNIKERLSTRISLLNSLEELQANLEGYDEGVKSLIKSKDVGAISGIHGVLIDFIETSVEFETAIESVLGDRLQGLVVESHDDCIKALEYLKSHSAGKAKFIPLTLRNLHNNGLNNVNSSNGFIGRATELLKYHEKYKGILECLLGDVFIVNDIQTALDIWRSNRLPYTFVTLDGEVIDPYGSITGGKRKGSEEGLMQRRRQIAEIRREIENLNIELDGSRKKRDDIQSEIESLESKITGLEKYIRDEEFKLKNEENSLSKINDEIERLKKKMHTLSFEEKEFDIEIGEFTGEADRYRNEIVREEDCYSKKVLQSNKLKEEIKILRTNLDTFVDDTNKIKITLTSLNGKTEGIRMEMNRIEKGRMDIEKRIEKREEEGIKISNRKKELEGTIRDIEDRIFHISLKRDEKKKEIIIKDEYLRERNEFLKGIEEEISVIEAELSLMRETLNTLGLKRSELNLQVNHLKKRAEEEYNVIESEIPGVDRGEINLEDIHKRLEFLRGEIERFGDVNLTAIEEYKTISERYTFLKSQQDDLIQSIKSLHQAIERIDSTTRQMFTDTFKKVNEHFKSIFRRLFGGGRADLILIDESNIIETGVDIIVQPPGKKLQNISLLSAGEKSMTAIALLFSVFMVKPSPFCLLDEIDAPLDESNIFRFRDMLKEMSAKTQFMIITHNQKTMSFADILYGVTMEDDGVSKVISVNLKGKEAKAA
ncbi:MAG: chromosome segregation protein SMC [Nitrospinae bacterium]|nr:chromosome segregation protein SMC [Nitrospinota bacterium]